MKSQKTQDINHAKNLIEAMTGLIGQVEAKKAGLMDGLSDEQRKDFEQQYAKIDFKKQSEILNQALNDLNKVI